MRKTFFYSMALLASMVMSGVQASSMNFMVAEHDFAYHANGDVLMTVFSADWSQTAEIVFRRGDLPEDRVHRDGTTGIVTLIYPIQELSSFRSLVIESTTVSFVYENDGVSETGYLYTIL